MPTYRVIGPCEVAGVQPGGLITEFGGDVNVDALIQGGHIEAVAEQAAAKKQPKDGAP